jgi:hypothetical protein
LLFERSPDGAFDYAKSRDHRGQHLTVSAEFALTFVWKRLELLFPCFKTKIDLHAKEDWQPPQSGQSLPHRIDQSGSTVSAASAIFGAWTKFQSENP